MVCPICWGLQLLQYCSHIDVAAQNNFSQTRFSKSPYLSHCLRPLEQSHPIECIQSCMWLRHPIHPEATNKHEIIPSWFCKCLSSPRLRLLFGNFHCMRGINDATFWVGAYPPRSLDWMCISETDVTDHIVKLRTAGTQCPSRYVSPAQHKHEIRPRISPR